MPWWGWLLATWTTMSFATAFGLGSAAATVRKRARDARRYQYRQVIVSQLPHQRGSA